MRRPEREDPTTTNPRPHAEVWSLPDARESGFFSGPNPKRHLRTVEADDELPTTIHAPRRGARSGSVPPPLPPSPARELREGEVLSEQYLVERVVGRMGSCVLVKVRHARLGQRFLLKYLAPEASHRADAVQTFLRGARSAMSLQSEHAARIVDAGRLASGAPYVVTEAFEGSELRELLRVRGALSVTDAVDFVLQASEAVAEAHRVGLVHGSLSPSTLFATRRSDGLPIIKVLEFGSSGTLRADPLAVKLRSWNQGTAMFWESSRLWDTLAYSAPEQLRAASEPTPLSDVWALAATLHELLCGAPPFNAETTTALLAAIVADSPAPLTSLCADLPRELESIVLRCLSKDPASRYPSVADLAFALRPFAAPETQLTVDRIARIQSHDPRQASLLLPTRAIVRVGPSLESPPPQAAAAPARAAASSASSPAPARSFALQLMGSALLVMFGVLGGTVAGVIVARKAIPAPAPLPQANLPAAVAVAVAPPSAAPASAPLVVGPSAPGVAAPVARIPAAKPAKIQSPRAPEVSSGAREVAAESVAHSGRPAKPAKAPASAAAEQQHLFDEIR